MEKVKLSVVIISKNEENYIGEAIQSASFADEVLVLDSYSTDNTCAIARSLNARVEKQKWLGFGKQKNKAIQLAKNDWVFVLDADERITDSLKKEIIDMLKEPLYSAYYVARLNDFFGQYIKTCGLYPDYSIRLFNRRLGKFNEVQVHESVEVNGKKGYLKSPMVHMAYDNVTEFINKQKYYAGLSNKPKNKFKAVFSPIWVFVKLYLLRFGFIDGWRGLVISCVYAQYTFWKYSK